MEPVYHRSPARPGGRRLAVLLCVTLSLLAMAGWQRRTQQRVTALVQQQGELRSLIETQQQRLARFEEELEAPPSDPAPGAASPRTSAEHAAQTAALTARILQLERSVRTGSGSGSSRSAVPEYNVAHPPAPEMIQPTSTPGRGWGFEQATGMPNTNADGDHPTAWAPRQPDGGAEWLWLDFPALTDLAEVRIRETYNAGAISRVTAMMNGREVVLWEGTAGPGKAPRDFVVPVSGNIRAQSVVLHLDTARVEGWNEIDAVELVGRDGSRQWASHANAGSTYAAPDPAN